MCLVRNASPDPLLVPVNRPMNIQLGWLGLGGATASAISAAGHSVIAIVAITAAGVLAVAIVTLGREWFWLCALRRPGRDLRRLLNITGNAKEAEALAALLAPSHAK